MDESKITEEEVKWAKRSHLSLLLFYPIFFILVAKGIPYSFFLSMLGTTLLPLYIWLSKGKRSKYISSHAKEAVFLQSFMSVLAGGSTLLWSGNPILKAVTDTFLSFYHIGSVITGSIKSSYRKIFNYPFSIFKRNQSKAEMDFEDSMEDLKSLENLDKVTAESLRETLKFGAEKIKEIDQLTIKIQDASAKDKVKNIREIILKIFENFKKDPDDIKLSRQFLNYYLDSTIKIIRKYIDLSQQKVVSTELTESLKRVDSLLETIKDAFEDHYNKLLANDIMDLDVEVKVMEQTMKAEGI